MAASPLLGTPPVLHLDEGLLYFDRYWLEERQVATDVLALTAVRPTGELTDITRLFPPGFEEQRQAAEVALSRGLTVLTGGPGTGKTTTVARLLALLAEQAALEGKPPLRIALAAPTGKAAARLQEAVQLEVDQLTAVDRDRLPALRATTLHRLLGSRPDTSSRFRHHRENRLPHDLIVVDETSMVSLTMMARLLEAVRPDARLLLVGDPDQLASVEAGAVLADLVDGLTTAGNTPVARLVTPHRFGESIGALAQAIRDGDADLAVDVLIAGGDHIEWVDTDQPADCLRTILVPQALRLERRPFSVTARRRWRPSTSTGCSARTDAGRTGSRTGTVRSNVGWLSRPRLRCGLPGTSAAHCWSPPTTMGSSSTTGTPASLSCATVRCERWSPARRV